MTTFTVVVATRGRPKQLARCLAALAAIKFERGDFEVVIVDDGGAAPVQAAPDGLRVTTLTQARRGPAAAVGGR